MTRDAVIDALAAAQRMSRWGIEVEPWEDLEDGVKEVWRLEIRAVWPLLVDLVAAWITGVADHGYLEPSEIAQRWREEMA
jgi:hypothetical protein